MPEIVRVETRVRAYAFEVHSGNIKVHSDKVQNWEEHSERSSLSNCLVGTVGNASIIRSALIESKTMAEELLQLLKQVDPLKETPIRFSSTLLNYVEGEGDAIQLQHARLQEFKGESFSPAVISFPLEKLYNAPKGVEIPKKLAMALEKFPRLLNAEAWIDYCKWFENQLSRLFADFRSVAVDAFTLEGHINDFKHEAVSPFLAKLRNRLRELYSAPSQTQEERPSYREMLLRERDMLLIRMELQKMLIAHRVSLVQIVRAIQSIEKSHPDLLPIKNTAMLLERLLADQVQLENTPLLSWGASQIILQLLDNQLGVISAIHGREGLGRVSAAFSLRLGILQLKQKYSLDDAIDLALHVDDIPKLSKTHPQDNLWKRRSELLKELQNIVFQNATDFSVPLTEINKSRKSVEGLKENLAILQFLPEQLVKSDPNGRPLGLTEQGHQLMKRLG